MPDSQVSENKAEKVLPISWTTERGIREWIFIEAAKDDRSVSKYLTHIFREVIRKVEAKRQTNENSQDSQ